MDNAKSIEKNLSEYLTITNMKQIIITITPTGLMIKATGVILIAIDPAGVISERLFLKLFQETALFCLN